MKSRAAPVVAMWLLESLLSGSDRETLLGDMVEQHSQGRSNLWFWRQTLAAVVLRAGAELRAQKLLVVRALLIAYLVPLVAGIVDAWAVHTAVSAGILENFLWSHTRYVYLALSVPSVFCLSWVIARLHPGRVSALLLTVLAIWCVVTLPYGFKSGANVFQHPRYFSYFLDWLFGTTARCISWLVGGVFGARKNSDGHGRRFVKTSIVTLCVAVAMVMVVTAAAITGTWDVEAYFDDNRLEAGGFDCVFKQDGERLNGTCSGGTVALTGEMKGQTVTWRIVSAENDAVTTTFTGILNEAGTRMEGRFLTNEKSGSFRAVRQ